MKEGEVGKILFLTSIAALAAGGCSYTPEPTPEATSFPDQPTVSVPSETPEPSHTKTSTPTVTLTPTPPPNWEATNIANLDSRLEGEAVDLLNVQVDEVLIFNPPGIKELVYGTIRDEEGSVRYIIENFDCQFRMLREGGWLGDLREGFLWRQWNISGITFERLTVIKSTELTGARFFTSQSYQLQGEVEVCPEDPVLRPATDAAQRAINWVRQQVIRITEGGN